MLAPIILFVYKRPEHTLKTLQALAVNKYASESELFVFADGPKENATDEDLEHIRATRAVISKFKGCASVNLIEREKNLNLEENVISGVTEIIDRYGKVIVLEDDIITAPNFLAYCNQGLDMYQEDKSVYSINGFMFAIDFKSDFDTFLCPLATSSWGWATWKDRWATFEHEVEDVSIFENNEYLRKRFDLADYQYFDMLKQLNTWDIRWYYTAFLRNGLGLFVTRSLTDNIGFDGSGTHGTSDSFNINLYQGEINIKKKEKIDLRKYSALTQYFIRPKLPQQSPSLIRRILIKIKRRLSA